MSCFVCRILSQLFVVGAIPELRHWLCLRLSRRHSGSRHEVLRDAGGSGGVLIPILEGASFGPKTSARRMDTWVFTFAPFVVRNSANVCHCPTSISCLQISVFYYCFFSRMLECSSSRSAFTKAFFVHLPFIQSFHELYLVRYRTSLCDTSQSILRIVSVLECTLVRTRQVLNEGCNWDLKINTFCLRRCS